MNTGAFGNLHTQRHPRRFSPPVSAGSEVELLSYTLFRSSARIVFFVGDVKATATKLQGVLVPEKELGAPRPSPTNLTFSADTTNICACWQSSLQSSRTRDLVHIMRRQPVLALGWRPTLSCVDVVALSLSILAPGKPQSGIV
jgi:hypothetical protein